MPPELNVRPVVCGPVGMFAGTPAAALNVTLWLLLIVHVTVPAAEMSTLPGANDNPGVVTLALAGKPAVTVIVWNADAVALPSVASTLMFAGPADTPVTSPVPAFTVATPVALELHASVAPAIGLPF